jgi:predicted peroxiredoxin
VLVLISEDPRVSHRAHEAMRIALGVAASDNDVSIVLSGEAAHLLDEDTDDLVDGDDVQKVRASLKKMGVAFHVETRPADPSWNADGHPVFAVEPAGIAALAARATRFIVF